MFVVGHEGVHSVLVCKHCVLPCAPKGVCILGVDRTNEKGCEENYGGEKLLHFFQDLTVR